MGLLTLVGLWGAYYVPHRLRQRAQALEARVDDRFSGSLRVLAVANDRAVAADGRGGGESRSSPQRLLTAPMVAVAAGSGVQRARGDRDMDRPTISRPVDGSRQASARAEVHERRAAAARRRLFLTLALLVGSVGSWIATSTAGLVIAVPVVLSTMFLGVLVLGRRAVVAGQRADEAERARARGRARTAQQAATRGRPPTATVTGRAVRSSQTNTELIATVADQVAQAREQARSGQVEAVAVETVVESEVLLVSPEGDASLTVTYQDARPDVASARDTADRSAEPELAGFSLPRPTYTMKATAPRREPAPLSDDDPDVTTPATASKRASAASASSADEAVAPEAAPGGLGESLDRILARRRAAGE